MIERDLFGDRSILVTTLLTTIDKTIPDNKTRKQDLFYNCQSRLMGKPTICLGENKAADQLCGNRKADQRLCFRYKDSTLPLLPKSEISSF